MKYDLDQTDFEVSLRISAIDSITGQNIFSGCVYQKDEIIRDARFLPCTEVTEQGVSIVHLDKIGAYEKVAR